MSHIRRLQVDGESKLQVDRKLSWRRLDGSDGKLSQWLPGGRYRTVVDVWKKTLVQLGQDIGLDIIVNDVMFVSDLLNSILGIQ